MGAGHGHALHFHGHSAVHRAPAHLKVLALVSFVLVVVATPNHAYPVFAGYAAVLLGIAALAHVPLTYLLPRLVVEVPFVVFALLLPFLSQGDPVQVLGVTVSQQGLVAAFGLLAKGTIGVLASLLLAATTEASALLLGLQRLRVPAQLVQIMSFMVRYLEVVTDELRRMHVARESRGFRARDPRQWPVLARTLGALFIRTYERGERVHLAMLARGYDGTIPAAALAGPTGEASHGHVGHGHQAHVASETRPHPGRAAREVGA
ncbi:cobalt ECF transporter T component CbiQ [Nocardioides sp. GY 10127]|uniref:cobalt ECF transporter T component CbiQ n=1 Tax=Nocardioides sp. GY 10127 TaxID=2569762 RepID=UPI0010A8CF7D|nr:cobalt ECF transporter T component CbiQ [Nocardioides sp. GY 10127]TIC81572.1 cobalt ECF transporter T component CbiQ [Nocardioides sp. GY 10127]